MPLITDEVLPPVLSHKYVYGALPPITDVAIAPFEYHIQVAFVVESVIIGEPVSIIVKLI